MPNNIRQLRKSPVYLLIPFKKALINERSFECTRKTKTKCVSKNKLNSSKGYGNGVKKTKKESL